MSPTPPPSEDSLIRDASSQWMIRRDRGLSAAESIEYELWLTLDPRHAEAMHRSAAMWARLDRIPESAASPILAAATRRRTFWRRTLIVSSLAAAALALVAIRLVPPSAHPVDPVSTTALNREPRQCILSDGSAVQLNTGSEVVEQFTATERRVHLAAGEAHFAVTKDPARPFVVQAGSIDISAVGTAFNVSLQATAVDVLVTEGIVQLRRSLTPAAGDAPAEPEADLPRLTANTRAVISLAGGALARPIAVVTEATPEEVVKALAWREPLLRLGGATLSELIVEFQRRSGQLVILADPAIGSLRVGGRFRADDVAGFTQLLAANLDLEVERTPEGAFVLRKKE